MPHCWPAQLLDRNNFQAPFYCQYVPWNVIILFPSHSEKGMDLHFVRSSLRQHQETLLRASYELLLSIESLMDNKSFYYFNILWNRTWEVLQNFHVGITGSSIAADCFSVLKPRNSLVSQVL